MWAIKEEQPAIDNTHIGTSREQSLVQKKKFLNGAK